MESSGEATLHKPVVRSMLLAGCASLMAAGTAQAALNVLVTRSDRGSAVAASDLDAATLRVVVQRGGVVAGAVDRPPGRRLFARLPLEAMLGDVITVVRNGVVAYQATFDGRPSFDASVCGTARTFSGLRPPGAENVRVSAYSSLNEYAPPASFAARVLLRGDTFSGTFVVPLRPSWRVAVQASFSLPGGLVRSTLERPAGACPPDAIPPGGRLGARPLRGGLRALLAGRATATVVVDEAEVRVSQALFLADGARLPATVATRRPRRPTVLARGRAFSERAGPVTVRLTPTRAARRLRGRRAVKVALVTTLRDRAGNVRRLPVKRLTLRRR